MGYSYTIYVVVYHYGDPYDGVFWVDLLGSFQSKDDAEKCVKDNMDMFEADKYGRKVIRIDEVELFCGQGI